MKSTIEILSYCPFCDRNWLQPSESTPEALILAESKVNASRNQHIRQTHLEQDSDPDLTGEVEVRMDCPECPRSYHVMAQPNIDDLDRAAGLVQWMLAEHFKTDHPSLEHLTEEVMEGTVSPLYLKDVLDIQIAQAAAAKLKAELEESAAAAVFASRCSEVKALAVKHFVKAYDLDQAELETALRITDLNCDNAGPVDGYALGRLELPEMEEIKLKLWVKWDMDDPDCPLLSIMEARTGWIWKAGDYQGRLLGPALVAAAMLYQKRLEWEAQQIRESIAWNERQIAKEEAEGTRVKAVAETLGQYPILIPVLEMVIEHIKAVDQLQAELEATEESSEEIERRLENRMEDLKAEVLDKTAQLQRLEHDIGLAADRRGYRS